MNNNIPLGKDPEKEVDDECHKCKSHMDNCNCAITLRAPISDYTWKHMPLSEKVFLMTYGTRPTPYEKRHLI